MFTYYVVDATHGALPNRFGDVCVGTHHIRPCTPSTDRLHCALVHTVMEQSAMEQILLWIIGGLFTLSLMVPGVWVIYFGALLLVSYLKDD